MTSPTEIKARFWKELKRDRTIMLGLDGAREGKTQPMTALFEGDEGGPLWIFTAKDNSLVEALGTSHRAIATFTGKSHDLFACITGTLNLDSDPAVIDRLWNPFVAAWFKDGKTDPKLALLRFDAEQAKIWLNGSSIGAALEWLLGRDPKESYHEKVAEVSL
jgi:general stress protein 26